MNKVLRSGLLILCLLFVKSVFSQLKKKDPLDYKNIFIKFDPYSFKINSEGMNTFVQLVDSLKRGAKNQDLIMYLRAYRFNIELEKDSFICDKRLAILSHLLYDSCLFYVKEIYSVNNFQRGNEEYSKPTKNREISLLEKYAGVFIVCKSIRKKK